MNEALIVVGALAMLVLVLAIDKYRKDKTHAETRRDRADAIRRYGERRSESGDPGTRLRERLERLSQRFSGGDDKDGR